MADFGGSSALLLDTDPYDMPQIQPKPTVVNNSTVVIKQPTPSATVTQVVNVPDSMYLAIFSCLCCFMPLGLVALVMACQSQNAVLNGDVDRAQSSARMSRSLSYISIATGVLIIIIIFVARAVTSVHTSSSSIDNK